MFDFFALNKTLFAECKKLVEHHNKLSYKSVALEHSDISFSFISKLKPKNAVTLELIAFYEVYTAQMFAAESLRTITDAILYSHEDLALHIDRSAESIVQIMSSLTETRLQLAELCTRIVENISTQVEKFKSYLDQNSEIEFDEFIEVLFECMKQEGLSSYINIHIDAKYFIVPGTEFVELIFTKLSAKQVFRLHQLNDELKQSVLSAKPAIHASVEYLNRLQTFGLVPDEGENINLQNAVKTLFGITMEEEIHSIRDAIEPLEKVLKLAIADSGVSTGLVIFVSPNADIFVDMSALMAGTHSAGAQGVTSNMVQQFNLIKQGSNSKVKRSELLAINLDNKTSLAYVLWTNDLLTFKLRREPIHVDTIRKLARRTPSLTIEAYNQRLSAMIEGARTNDAVNFKRVQYMTFDKSVSEESFLKLLQSKLVESIMRLGKSSITESFSDDTLDVIDAAKSELGIHPSLLPSHCHIIYASMALKITSKLKKRLVELSSPLDKATAMEIVKEAVEGNDNIYSRVIASYYLHIA